MKSTKKGDHVSRMPVALGCLAMLLIFGCTRQTEPQAKSNEIVVGSLLALTGQHKSFGITQQQGMKVALEDIAKAGGIEGADLRVEFADTQLNEDLGLQEYKRLVAQHKVPAIVGSTGSGVVLRIAPFANQDHTVILASLETSPKITGAGDYIFRNIASDAYSGKVLAAWALSEGKKVAGLVYNSENAWARGCQGAVESAYTEAGGRFTVSPSPAVLDSTDNFGSVVIALRDSNPKPDVIFVCLMGRQAGLFAAQAVASQLNGPFFGTDTFSQQEFVDNAGPALGRAFYVLPGETESPKLTQFTSRYTELFKDKPDSIAAKAYDALQIMAETLRTVKRQGKPITGENIRKNLQEIRYNGITGLNSFDRNGDLETAQFDRLTYKDKQPLKLQ